MANLTDIITQEIPSRAGREEFVRTVRGIRDSIDIDGPEGEESDAKARQWLTWHRILIAAELLVSSAPS